MSEMTATFVPTGPELDFLRLLDTGHSTPRQQQYGRNGRFDAQCSRRQMVPPGFLS